MTPKRTIRLMLVVALAVTAFSAVAAHASEGPEGPFFTLGEKRLGPEESKEMKGFLSEGSHLQVESGETKVTCSTLKFHEGAKLIGSSPGNPGKGQQTIESEGCSAKQGTEECKVEKEKISTEPLELELGYQTNKREGDILARYTPISGKVLAKVHLEGKCEPKTIEYEGTVIAEAFSKGKPVEVGKEPREALEQEVNFPSTPIEKGWFESSGTLSEKKAQVIVGTKPAILALRLTLGLKETAWGWNTTLL